MNEQKIAVLDRRVRVDKPPGRPGPTFRRNCELRSFPYVEIGERGLGNRQSWSRRQQARGRDVSQGGDLNL